MSRSPKRLKWYAEREVEKLVSNYAELREAKEVSGPGLRVLLLLADLDRAISKLLPKEYQAVLLHGQLGYTVRDAEVHLGVSRSTLHDRYASGIRWLTNYLNGETE